MSTLPTCSMIVTTYNKVDYLRCSLNSLLDQVHFPDEVVIADDGSKPETKEFIDEFRKKCPFPIVHSWHPDEGYRLAKTRNRAIKVAQFDYIIQTDGDLFFHKNFVLDHLIFARKGAFVRGGRTHLDKLDTQKTIEKNELHFETSKIKKITSAYSIPILRNVFSFLGLPKKGIMGCNMAFWREDAIKVNGYDHRFKSWGKEDDEFIARLENNGIRKRSLKFGGIVYHLNHPTSDLSTFVENENMFKETKRLKVKRCEEGIQQIII